MDPRQDLRRHARSRTRWPASRPARTRSASTSIRARRAASTSRRARQDIVAGDRRRVLTVGVFVDATLDAIARRRRKTGFDCVQLHGDESPDAARRASAARVQGASACAIASVDSRHARSFAGEHSCSTPTCRVSPAAPARRSTGSSRASSPASARSRSPAASRPTTSRARSRRCARSASTSPAASSPSPGSRTGRRPRLHRRRQVLVKLPFGICRVLVKQPAASNGGRIAERSPMSERP